MEQYLNKSVRIECVDSRTIWGVLVCISKPYSIIVQNGVCHHEPKVPIDLQFHYNPQFASKPFLPQLDQKILNAFENLSSAKQIKDPDPSEIQELERYVEEAKQHDQDFMRGKYYIGSLVLQGQFIKKIHLIK